MSITLSIGFCICKMGKQNKTKNSLSCLPHKVVEMICYCHADSLSSFQRCSCMDHLQLSLRGQLFLTHFCVSSTGTGCTARPAQVFSRFPWLLKLLSFWPLSRKSQAARAFFRDGPHGVSLLVQPGPSANRPHQARPGSRLMRASTLLSGICDPRRDLRARTPAPHSYQAMS